MRRFGIDRLVLIGSTITLGAVAFSAALMAGGLWAPLALFAPMGIAAIGNGLSIPNTIAGAMSVNRQLAGTASGVTGFSQMLVSAVVSQAVGELHDGTPYPMMTFMVACAALSLAGYVGLRRVRRERP
ncbi:MAG: hypothetical protein M5U09_02540 [Gammaproteobacteria bacterium]|nr:hypothetical protein [Gammaproteobacteria bacterium]